MFDSRSTDRRRTEPSMDRERITLPTVTIQVPAELHTHTPAPGRVDEIANAGPTPAGGQENGATTDQETGWVHRISVLLGYAGPNARARREKIMLYSTVSFRVTEVCLFTASKRPKFRHLP